MDYTFCDKHDIKKEVIGGCSAHPNNWYCTKCDEENNHCNHHHELTDQHEMVDFGDGEFVANKAAIPLLKALAEMGLRTRTHHYDGGDHGFFSILLEGVRVEIKEVDEIHADRTKYNGLHEVLISW